MLIDILLASGLIFLFYVVNKLIFLYVMKLDRRLREHGIYD